MALIKKTCATCGRPFEAGSALAERCSVRCRVKAHRERRRAEEARQAEDLERLLRAARVALAERSSGSL